MAKQTTEEEFNLRRQARRRLIGAIALVLLAVILLPVVFDNEPAPSTGNNIELRIPDKDNVGEFQPKINLPELDKMASEVVAASAVAKAPTSTTVTAPVRSEKPSAATTAASKAEKEIKAKPQVTHKAVSKPPVAKSPVAKPQDVPKTGWVVQVGAYANVDTARNLRTKLSKQGYHAYTEKAGTVVRVRVGSYPTLDEAEKVKNKLNAQGMQSNVVNLE
jgi:DedD protein